MKDFNLLAATPILRMVWFQRPSVTCYPDVAVMLSFDYLNPVRNRTQSNVSDMRLCPLMGSH